MTPICVDLDGTLIKNDVTQIACWTFIKERWTHVFCVLYWLLRGRAHLKHQLANRIELNVASLRYNFSLLNYLRQKKEEGHRLFLATACNRKYAESVAVHIGIFDGIFASDEYTNLRAAAKARALVLMFGEKGFIYAGNSADDVYVWRHAAECILVNPSCSALRSMRNCTYKLFN